MTCRKVVPLIDDFTDGSLVPDLNQNIQQHIEHCRKCRAKIDDINRLKTLLERFKIPDPGRSYFIETTDLILGKTSGKRQSVSRFH